MAIGAGLDQVRGRTAVDKLLMRRNSGSGLRELDLALPVGAGFDKLAQIRGRPAVDKLLMRRNSGSGLRELDLGHSGWSWP